MRSTVRFTCVTCETILYHSDLLPGIEQTFHCGKNDRFLRRPVRLPAKAEDLPDASFAGEQETFLNVHGFYNVVSAMGQVYASLFNDRAIAYRVHQGSEHRQVTSSVGVQTTVRSDVRSSGITFMLDTELVFHDAVFITSPWGLGQTVVQGAVNRDEYYVYKPAVAAERTRAEGEWQRRIARRNDQQSCWGVLASDTTDPDWEPVMKHAAIWVWSSNGARMVTTASPRSCRRERNLQLLEPLVISVEVLAKHRVFENSSRMFLDRRIPLAYTRIRPKWGNRPLSKFSSVNG